MEELKKLPQRLAQQISSGQVIVEPASVVKELVENALDANATSVTCAVRMSHEGFMSIEVSDNGELCCISCFISLLSIMFCCACAGTGNGIDSVDQEYCAQRHYTSKLASFEQLQDGASIQSFGFRGEALHSICECAGSVTITTRAKAKNSVDSLQQEATQVATMLTLDRSGNIESRRPCSHRQGTTVKVSGGVLMRYPVRASMYKGKGAKCKARRAAQVFVMSCFVVAFDMFGAGKTHC